MAGPLSPTLFILIEEVFSWTLSWVVTCGLIQIYHLKRGYSIILHSLFVDDMILFLNGCKRSIKRVISIILSYEQATWQLLNASKCNFMVTSFTTISTIWHIQDIIRFSQEHLPFDYLGCPIFLGCTHLHYFDTLLCKPRKKLVKWKLQLLFLRGHIQLIYHMLMSMFLYLFEIHKVLDTILWFLR